MNTNLTNKVVLITGAAGTIGKGVAAGFLAEGAKVFITDIDPKAITTALGELSSKGTIQGLAGDVTNEEQVVAVVEATKKAFGGAIDVLVNVAGIVGQGKVEDLTVKDWDKMFAVNCKGTFLFCKYVVPVMKAQKSGKIFNYSSKSGKTGSAIMSHYSAAKAAVIGFTQALAYELADFNINVNCICPGITDNTGVWGAVSAGYIENLNMPREQVVKKFSEKIPLKRLAAINDLVAVTVFMCSSGADYMTGQAINVTGGREMH